MAVKTVEATINGSKVTLTYSSTSGLYEATVTAPNKSSYNQPDHYYGVSITATDDSGNTTTVSDTVGDFQDELKLTVKEKVVPVITVTVSGTTNDTTSSPVTVTVNGTNVTVGSDGRFSYEFTLSEGSNTITIIAKDKAGKTTTVTRHVTLDTGAPKFESIEITPNPVDAGKTYIIKVKVTDE